MNSNMAVKRYAQALFDIGQSLDEDSARGIRRDLGVLKDSLDVSPKLAGFFDSPIFSLEEKKKVILNLLEIAEIRNPVKNFCLLIAEKGRLSCLRDIVIAYNTMLDRLEGIVHSEFVTAIELSMSRQEEIKSRLENQVGKKLDITFAVDPSIIGGMIFRMGDKTLDGSLRAQINILKENIKRG